MEKKKKFEIDGILVLNIVIYSFCVLFAFYQFVYKKHIKTTKKHVNPTEISTTVQKEGEQEKPGIQKTVEEKKTGSPIIESQTTQPESPSPRRPEAFTPATEDINLADFTLRDSEDGTKIYQWKNSKNIFLIDFKNRKMQGKTMNRISYFMKIIEEVLPKDKMEEFVDKNDEPGGHHASSSDLAMFFEFCRIHSKNLSKEEEWLREFAKTYNLISIAKRGYRNSGDNADNVGIITISRYRNLESRRMIFQHELKHAAYMASVKYRRIIKSYWERTLTEEQREFFRLFILGLEGEKAAANKTLLLDEWQAYLINYDPAWTFFYQAGWGLEDNVSKEGKYKRLLKKFESVVAEVKTYPRIEKIREDMRKELKDTGFSYVFLPNSN